MHKIVNLAWALAVVALVAAGCSGTKPTPASGGATPTAAKSDQKSDGSTPATTDQPKDEAKDQGANPAAAAVAAAPLVDATKAQQEAASVQIKAVDAAGKVVELVFKPIFFDFDSYVIKPEYQSTVESNASTLGKANGLKIIIEGHCDERGTTEYNFALGLHRAVAVQKAMAAAGASKDQMKTVSKGKEVPLDPGHTEEAWAKNRRGVIRNNAG